MTNQTGEITYQSETAAVPRFSRLFWAAAAAFTLNVSIAAAISFSPELSVNMYGQESERYINTNRPSPFTEVVEAKPARKVRRAQRLQPVTFEQAPEPSYYSSGTQAYLEVERLSDYPRFSAAAKPVAAEQRLIN